LEPGQLLEHAAELTAATDGLAMSVAAVGPLGDEHAATFGAPEWSLFPSCSSFKPVVAAAVRSAAADGLCQLDVPVRSLPGGEVAPPGWDATLELVLGHLSGLAGDLYEVCIDGSSDGDAAAELLRRYLPVVPRVAPGRFWYSNLGYALAGQVLAHAEGDDLLAVLRRRVLDPAGAEVTTDAGIPGAASPSSVVAPAFGRSPGGNASLRAAGGGTVLRAVDLARVGAALAGGALRELGVLRTEPDAVLAGTDQHPAGGFFLDLRYGRPLLAHGGGHGAYGSAWIVDPTGGWSAVALFNHPAGYGLDVAATVLGQERGRDPLRSRPVPAAGWYLNPYAGVAQVTGDELRLNGRSVRARCVADGDGIVVNPTRIVIGALPYDPIAPPDAVAAPALAGTYTSDEDELTIALEAEAGPAAGSHLTGGVTATVRSQRRGDSPAVVLAPTTLASDHGVLELRGDDLVVGGAYRLTRI
jgi:CubicO group peptidase (beta-lactamase class C family)